MVVDDLERTVVEREMECRICVSAHLYMYASSVHMATWLVIPFSLLQQCLSLNRGNLDQIIKTQTSTLKLEVEHTLKMSATLPKST